MSTPTLSLDEVVQSAERMLRLPKSALAIYDLVQNEDSSLNEVSIAIEADPAFAAQLLRLANSTIYSRGVKVSDLDTAVRRIGRSDVGQLAFMMAFGPAISVLENTLMSTTSYWKHSVTTGILARRIARRCGMKTDAVFCAALLHDIGLQVMFALLSEDMMKVLEQSLDLDEAHIISEFENLGYDHTVVGAAVATAWNLPSPMVEAIRYHHHPSEAKDYPKVSAVVALANLLSNRSMHDEEDELYEIALRKQITAALGDLSGVLDERSLVEQAQQEAEVMLAQF